MLSPEEYRKECEKIIPPTNETRNLCGAFFIGGAICTFGQVLVNTYKDFGFDTPTSSLLTSVSLIFLSALLTGLGIYDELAKLGGGGTLVPITGFANAVVSPAMEFRSEGWVLGIGVRLFTIAGPVLVYGLSAGIFYGIIYYIFTALV